MKPATKSADLPVWPTAPRQRVQVGAGAVKPAISPPASGAAECSWVSVGCPRAPCCGGTAPMPGSSGTGCLTAASPQVQRLRPVLGWGIPCWLEQLNLMELNLTVETCVGTNLRAGSYRASHQCPGDLLPAANWAECVCKRVCVKHTWRWWKHLFLTSFQLSWTLHKGLTYVFERVGVSELNNLKGNLSSCSACTPLKSCLIP